MTCLPTLSSYSVNHTIGKDASSSLMHRRTNILKQVEQGLACSTLRSLLRLLSHGSHFPFSPALTTLLRKLTLVVLP